MGDVKIDETRHYTRSSTRGKVLSATVGMTQNTTGRGGPNQYKIWDRGKDTLKTAHYPYHELVKPLTLSAKQNNLPAGFPLSPTMQLIETMFACDVERILPRHWHQTKGHPLESFLQLAEIKELQDCCNRGVFGEPEEITEDMVAIGLMWVYAIKQYDASGLFRKFRARITLLGNQEKHLLDKILAYAPVAQAVTARLMIASHLHLVGIIYRKLDVSNAYINEFMKRKVYCKMPPGYTLIVTKSPKLARFRGGAYATVQCASLRSVSPSVARSSASFSGDSNLRVMGRGSSTMSWCKASVRSSHTARLSFRTCLPLICTSRIPLLIF